MNANELDGIIEHLENARYIGASKAAEMLRQQQAKIEALKAEIVSIEKNTDYWADKATHPVKELTDEEIDELWDNYLSVRDEYGEELQILGVHDFAKAILRKAQEK